MTGGLHRLAQTVGALQKDTSQAIDVRSWAGMERSENSGKTDENWWKTDEHWCKASKSWSVWKTIDVVVFDGFSYTCKYCSKKMCREKRLQTCAFPFKPDMSIAICSSAVRLRTASNLLPRRWKSSRHLGNPWAGFAWFPSRANSGLWP